MAQLLVRNLEESIIQKLRERATREGISVEEAHRRLLRQHLLEDSVGKPRSFKEYLADMPPLEDGLPVAQRADLPRSVDLD